MIQLIVGGKGSGKTKKMIDMINASAKTTPGNIVCIEKSMKLTYDIDHSARLIDVDEYSIDGYDMLYGFIAGVLAGNYDIVEVYLDGVLKLGHHDLDALGACLCVFFCAVAGRKMLDKPYSNAYNRQATLGEYAYAA